MGGRMLLGALAMIAAACSGGETSPNSTIPDATTMAAADPAPTGPTGATAATTTVEPPPPVEPPPSIDWTRVSDDATFDAGSMSSVVVGGPGLVAVGTAEQGAPQEVDAGVWVSADGTSWERIESEVFGGEPNRFGVEGGQYMTDIVASPFGLVAVGAAEDSRDHDFDAAVWLSPDGITWSRVAHDEEVFGGPGMQEMRAVVSWGPGLVAVGESGGSSWGDVPTSPAVWISRDGVAWDRVDSAVLAEGGPATMSDVTVVGPHLVAVGSAGFEITLPAVWVSGDGVYWERIPDDVTSDWDGPVVEVGDPEPGRSIWMTAVGAGDDGNLAAVGNQSVDDIGVVWISSEEFDWTRTSAVTDIENPHYPVELTDVIWHNDLLVVVGNEPYSGTDWEPASLASVWVSQDRGVNWHQVTSINLVPGWPPIAEVIPFGSGLLAVGSTRVADYVWKNTNPDPWPSAAVWIGTWAEVSSP